MFNAFKAQILGPKAAVKTKKVNSSDIPIFHDVGIIGCPQPDSFCHDASVHVNNHVFGLGNASEIESPFRKGQDEGGLGSKRTRRTGDIEEILQDKENVPKIPKVSNTIQHMVDKKETKKPRKTVVIEESKNSFMDDSSHNRDDDLRFTTVRSQGEKVSGHVRRVANTVDTFDSEENDDDDEVAQFSTSGRIVSQSNDNGTALDEDEIEEKLKMQDFLFSKVRHNHYDVVEAAIKGGSHDFTGRFSIDNNGNTLVHVAVQNNLKKMCSLLIKDAGCEMNLENYKGMTPLDYTEVYRFTALTDWLLSKGAINGSAPRK